MPDIEVLTHPSMEGGDSLQGKIIIDYNRSLGMHKNHDVQLVIKCSYVGIRGIKHFGMSYYRNDCFFVLVDVIAYCKQCCLV